MLTTKEKLLIRARSGVAADTLNAYLADPSSVRSISATRIEDAARAEGITLPSASRPISSSPPPEEAA